MGRLIAMGAAIIGAALVLAALWSVARPPPDLPRRPAPSKTECDPLSDVQTDPICMTEERYRTYLGPDYQRGASMWTPAGFVLGTLLFVVSAVLFLRRPPVGGDTMLSALSRPATKR